MMNGTLSLFSCFICLLVGLGAKGKTLSQREAQLRSGAVFLLMERADQRQFLRVCNGVLYEGKTFLSNRHCSIRDFEYESTATGDLIRVKNLGAGKLHYVRGFVWLSSRNSLVIPRKSFFNLKKFFSRSDNGIVVDIVSDQILGQRASHDLIKFDLSRKIVVKKNSQPVDLNHQYSVPEIKNKRLFFMGYQFSKCSSGQGCFYQAKKVMEQIKESEIRQGELSYQLNLPTLRSSGSPIFVQIGSDQFQLAGVHSSDNPLTPRSKFAVFFSAIWNREVANFF